MGVIAFTNALLFDGTGSAPVSGAVVLVEDAKIQSVDTDGTTPVPPDATVIDLAGQALLPGLMDLHMHICGPAYRPVRLLRQSLAAGFTTVAHVGGMLVDELRHLKEGIENGNLPDCSRLLTGAVVTATNGHVSGRTADGPWEVRKAVREQVQGRADFIKTAASGGFLAEDEECWWEDYTFEELQALVHEAHSVGKHVAAHCHTQPGLSNCIRAGVDAIHHGAFIDEQSLEQMVERGIYFVPTLRVTSMRNIEIKQAAGRPWESRKMREAHEIHREGVRYAHKVGVKMALGTDLPSTPPWDAGDSAVELEEFVLCGLSPLEALRTATLGAAECMGIDETLGSIAVGKVADLVAVDAQVFQDVRVLRDPDNISLVMKDGVLRIDRRHQDAAASTASTAGGVA